MKNIFKISLFAILFLVLNSCSPQMKMAPEKVTSLLQGGEFTFLAERANPSSNDVVNVLNSLPNTSASQILNLDYGYTVEIKKSQISVDLPYFGNMHVPNVDREKNSFHFISKDFKLTESAGKKGSIFYKIDPKDQQNGIQLSLEVYKNGQAYLFVNSNDRQSISYDGYIKQNMPTKK